VRGEVGSSPERQVLSVVGWLLRQGEDVNEELIAGVYEIARTAKRASVRLQARKYIIDHFDPVPRAPVIEVTTGPVSLSWSASPSLTPLAPSRPPSTSILPAVALEPPSSSATDVLENL